MQKPLRILWLAAGYLCLLLGLIGAFLPVMPTTIFLIMAVACFSRGNPRLSAWLLAHPRYGQPLRLWHEHRAMSRRSKTYAISTIIISMSWSTYLLYATHPLLAGSLVLFGTGLTAWIGRLPIFPSHSKTYATIKKAGVTKECDHGSQSDSHQQL